MKHLKYFCLAFIIIPCLFLLNGCSLLEPEEKVYITNIVQTENVGNSTTYTIYYSNGKTSLLSIKDGVDGEDGKDGENGLSMTLEEVEQYCANNGYDFEEFLKNFNIVEETTIVNENSSVQYAANKAINSAVTIWSEHPGSSSTPSLSRGAGIIYKMEDVYSYIITNYHVVYYKDSTTANKIASKITLFQYGGDEAAYKSADDNSIYVYGEGAVSAEYIGGSMSYDIALLKVKTEDLKQNNEHVTPVQINEKYNLGETTVAIGNPEGEGFAVTSGIVSVVSEEIEMKGADESTNCEFRVIRTDTAVNGGNSGGGLFNIKGELIGIVNAKAVSSDIDNIAYALPIDNVTKVAENILYYYNKNSSTPAQVKKLVLDIEYTIVNYKAEYDPINNITNLSNEIKVVTVDPVGVGHILGLQPNDIINSIIINNAETPLVFNLDYQLKDILLTLRVGDKFILNVTRDNQSIQLGITNQTGILDSYLDVIK